MGKLNSPSWLDRTIVSLCLLQFFWSTFALDGRWEGWSISIFQGVWRGSICWPVRLWGEPAGAYLWSLSRSFLLQWIWRACSDKNKKKVESWVYDWIIFLIPWLPHKNLVYMCFASICFHYRNLDEVMGGRCSFRASNFLRMWLMDSSNVWGLHTHGMQQNSLQSSLGFHPMWLWWMRLRYRGVSLMPLERISRATSRRWWMTGGLVVHNVEVIGA